METINIENNSMFHWLGGKGQGNMCQQNKPISHSDNNVMTST